MGAKMKILFLLIFTSFTLFSNGKNEILEIHGFENTYYWNPISKKFQFTNKIDSNENKRPIRYEYTNFDGITIERETGSVKRDYGKEAISNINFANDQSKDYYSLYFTLNKPYKVKIELYSKDGKKIADLFYANFKIGSNQVIINKKYPKGVYLIHFVINDKIKQQRVLFQ
jgi:hypothetical protein